jgi:hypothetical protein
MIQSRGVSIPFGTVVALAVLLATACGTFEVGIVTNTSGTQATPTAAGKPFSTSAAPMPSASPAIPQPTTRPSEVTTVAVTPDGAVWYGFGWQTWPPRGGGGVKRQFDGAVTHFGLDDGLPDENVQVLKVAPDGVLWAGAGRYVARFNGRTWEVIEPLARYIDSVVQDIAFTPDGAVWIASPFELVRFDGRSVTMYDRMVHALAVAPDGAIWASGWEGLQDSAYVGRFDGLDWTTHNTIEAFQERVAKIAITPDGLVCGATGRHGVVCLDGQSWREYTTADGLPSNAIVDIGVAPDGLLWAVTDYGVAYFDGSAWASVDDAPPWIRTMAFAPDATIWFGTSTGTVENYEPKPEIYLAMTPSAPETEAAAQIMSFEVAPAQIDPGDAVTLTWEAQGDRATICPSTRFVLFAADDCWDVPLSGTTTFTVPEKAAGAQFIGFNLTVESDDSPSPAVGWVSTALKCETSWFFTDDPQAGICPREPIQSYAAAQRFERGTMLWIEELGRYVILEETPLPGQDARKLVSYVQDPLEITRDTSAEVHPPTGLHAPVSGFGLVWRGDVKNSAGYQESLGWALEPEFGYDTVFQCDDALPSGGRSWQTCYLKGPNDEVIVLHPLGGWQLLGEGERMAPSSDG